MCAGGPPKPISPIRSHSRRSRAGAPAAGSYLNAWRRLFETGGETPRTGVPPGMRRWRRGCGRATSTSSSGRSTCSARARRCGPRSSRASRTARSSTGRPGPGRRRWRGSPPRGAEGAFEEVSAVNAGRRRDPRGDRARAGAPRGSGRPTIFFLDEIHRFNKAQQDALLPAVEEGLVTLIGATTENPYFEVNSALLSRCQIYELRPLDRRAGRGAAAAGARATPSAGIADPPAGRRTRRSTMLADALRRRRPGRARRRSSGRSRRLGAPASASRRRRGRGRAAAQGARSTTARATATTTTSRPGSRRPAAPTSTPRSTTWR